MNIVDLHICDINIKDKNLWNEVNKIMIYFEKSTDQIKNVYAIYENNENLLKRNKITLKYNFSWQHGLDTMTNIEKMMYNVVTLNMSNSHSESLTYVKLELPIEQDNHNNFLLIETIDNLWLVARFGKTKINSRTMLRRDKLYMYAGQKDFYIFSSLDPLIQQAFIHNITKHYS